MDQILLQWFASALVVLGFAYILPGVSISSLFVALVVALVLGLANTVVKPVAILFTLPITIFTLGLFTFVIDALLVLLTAAIIPGFKVESFGWALLLSLLLSLANGFFRAEARRIDAY